MKDRLKTFLAAFGGLMAAALIIGYCWGMWVLWDRAAKGADAHQFIVNQLEAQKAQQAKPPAPVPPPALEKK